MTKLRNAKPRREDGSLDTRLRTLKPRREDGSLDGIFASFGIAFIICAIGIACIAVMFNNHGYWEDDDTLPGVFVMFAKVINFSTIGVLAIFVAVVIAVAAIFTHSVRTRHEESMAANEEITANQETILDNQEALKAENAKILENQGELTRQGQQIIAMQAALMGSRPPSLVPWPDGTQPPNPVRGWDTGPMKILTQRHADDIAEARQAGRQEGYEEGFVDGVEAKTQGVQGKVHRLPTPLNGHSGGNKDDHS